MNDKIKNALANKNGRTNERYKEAVRERVANTFDTADETAILRKAVAVLFDVVATLHAGAINNTEFSQYHAIVEKIKSEVKTELGHADQ